MNFDKDDIVTLDNGKEYYLIDKQKLDGEIYFYAVVHDKELDKMVDNEYCFFQLEEKEYLTEVEDEKTKQLLAELFIKDLKQIVNFEEILNYSKENFS